MKLSGTKESIHTPLTNQPAIIDQYLTVGLEAVQEAEKVILQYFNQDITVDLKSDQSPVTIADKKAEAKIKQVIAHYFPDHGFLGEEEGRSNPASQFTWVIDPIDGTKNFIRGLPFFSTLLALVKDNEVILGISNMPQFNELVYAVKGKGSFLNHQQLQVSRVDQLENSYLSIGTLKRFTEKGLDQKLLKLSSLVQHQRAWGDCWHFHLLAQGKIDAVVEAYGKFWDFAPMAVFIEEAGGKVSDIKGNKFGINSESIVATNGLIHNQIIQLLNI